jgi:hypothetical protein
MFHWAAGELIKYLMVNMGVMATITQSIDAETGIRVAEAFGKRVGVWEATKGDSPGSQTSR